MTTWVSLRNLGVVAVLSLAWGCGPEGVAPKQEDESEHLGSSTQALTATGSGTAYANQCAANGVPFPPTFDTAHVLPPGSSPSSNYGKWIEQANTIVSYTGLGSAKVYTSRSIQAGQEGMCAIIAHFGGGGSSSGPFDVICQGMNGFACFWEKIAQSEVPTSTSVFITAMDGGTALDTSSHPKCTACHAGRNAFIAHHGANDGLNQQNDPFDPHSWWMPSAAWYTPIVPAGWPENPGPSPAGYPQACLGCHSAAGPAGPFPTLRSSSFTSNDYCHILDAVTRNPPSLGGMPPSEAPMPAAGWCSGPNAPNCPVYTDPQVQAMLAACGKPEPSGAVSYKNSPVVATASGSSTAFPGAWDHALVGTDVYGDNKMLLFNNKFNPNSSGGSLSGWSSPTDYTASLKSYYRPTMWAKDDDGSKLTLASTDYSGQIWESQSGTGGGLRRVSSGMTAAGSPFGYRRFDGVNAVVFRGTDNYIYESIWNIFTSTWSTAKLTPIPAGQPAAVPQLLQASGDPIAYNRGSTSSIIYKCADLLCEMRFNGSGWVFRTITTQKPLKGSTMPAPFKRSSSSEYMIFYAADDGLRMIKDFSEPAFGSTDESPSPIWSGLIGSSPAPYNAQDNGIRVAFIADNAAGSTRYLDDLMLPYGSTTWSIATRMSTPNTVPMLTGDPAAYISTLWRNTIVFRNTANTVYQLQTINSSMGDVSFAKTTIQKGYQIDTSGSLTPGQEQAYSFYLPPGQYKFDMAPSSGDADLYVKLGDTPTTTVYDCRPYASGTTAESCTSTIPGPAYGYINVMVRGYAPTTSSAFTLRGYYND